MSILAVQYLEGGGNFVAPHADEVQARLREMFGLLPVTDLLIGWDVGPELAQVCRKMCKRAGARLYQWHPLLVGWGRVAARPEWRVVGADGEPMAGFQGRPEFTFLRPDEPAVQEAVLGRLERAVRSGLYDGIFLDRIRYPVAEPRFAGRAASITHIVAQAAGLIRAAGLSVGLDCFAPSLAAPVGQDLGALSAVGDWVKLMLYGHTWAPAGMPFEMGLQEGLPQHVLAAEVERGRAAGVKTLLAGIELVEIEGVTRLSPPQIRADLEAIHGAGADGLVLSWDLKYMPDEYMELVAASVAG